MQQIGSRPIQYAKNQKPFPPTAKSWVLTYTKLEGVMNHSDLIRGNFVYRSQITRHLNSQDKSKVIQLLTAYDRNEPLRVDIDKKLILWGDTGGAHAIPKEKPQSQQFNLQKGDVSHKKASKKNLQPNTYRTSVAPKIVDAPKQRELKTTLRRKGGETSDSLSVDTVNSGDISNLKEEPLSPYKISPMGIKK